MCEMDSCCPEECPVPAVCEYGNETWDYIKGGELRDQLRDCHLFKKEFVPWS
jgi:hypothetical protein